MIRNSRDLQLLAAVACILEGEGRRTGNDPTLAKLAKEYLDGLAKRLAVGYTMSAAEAVVIGLSKGCISKMAEGGNLDTYGGFVRWRRFVEDVLGKDAELRS